MGKINVARWILGGIVAGIVGDIVGFLVDGWWLAGRWAADMTLLGKPTFNTIQIIQFNIVALVVGVVAIWIYAGIRPRFGPGPKTAIAAGLAVWIVGFLLPNISFMYIPYLFSHHLTLFTTLGNLVSCVLGTLAGAAVYKEE
jgi:hypothetical protein